MSEKEIKSIIILFKKSDTNTNINQYKIIKLT